VKGSKASAFLQEVAQQPAALGELIAHYRGAEGARLELWAGRARKIGRVVFSGMGTSEFAPDMLLAALARQGVAASTVDAGELLHYPRPVPGMLVLVSQSGESVETRKLATRCQPAGGLAAIVNDTESTVARAAELMLPMYAGRETAISTKTYVNTLAVLHLMAQALRGTEAVEEGLRRLEEIADAMPQCDEAAIAHGATLLSDAAALHFISRGPAMVAAKQAALTFMEGARLSTVAFTGGLFRHGPFELVDASHRCVFFIPGGATCHLLTAMAQELVEKGSHVVVVSDESTTLPEPTCCVLKVPDFGEELFALSAATTQALLLDAVARERGLQAGVFRYGQKVTTRE